MTDEVLVKRAADGDEAAFLLLYERHRRAVYHVAYRLTGSREAAEDITHDEARQLCVVRCWHPGGRMGAVSAGRNTPVANPHPLCSRIFRG